MSRPSHAPHNGALSKSNALKIKTAKIEIRNVFFITESACLATRL